MKLLHYFIAALPLPLLAIINGTIRQLLIIPKVGEHTANQISCLTGCLFFAIYTWLLAKYWQGFPHDGAWKMGLIWVTFAVVFEFGMGIVLKSPPSKMLHEYNLLAGRLWVLVLVWTFFAPIVMGKLAR
jgi:hypothetical protein